MADTTVTLNKLIEEIEAVANAHEMLNSFHYGEFLNIYQSGKIDYNTLLMNVNNATLDAHWITMNVELAVMDKVFKDKSSLNDVESDTLQILTDFYSVITTSFRWQSFSQVAAATPMRKFISKGEDQVTGWGQTVQLKIKRKNGLCDLPISGYDYDGEYTPSCAGVKIYEDLIYIRTVESGGSFYYNTDCAQVTLLVNGAEFTMVDSGDSFDLNVVNQDGTQVGEKDGDDYVVPYSDDIYYNRRAWTDTYYVQDYDEAWHILNGINDYVESIPVGAKIQQVDYSDLTVKDRLIYNNIHGHKFRFTGVNGGYYNPDDSNYYDVDGNISDKATEFPTYLGTRYFIIDHLSGIMWIGVRLGGINFNTNLTDARDATDGGYTDWIVPSKHDAEQLFDSRYNLNLYEIERPPWDYNQLTYWTCSNYPQDKITRAWYFHGYNMTAGDRKTSTGANRSRCRIHLTGTIN